jgi:hypothetical protein
MAERPRQDLKLRGSTDTSVALADILKGMRLRLGLADGRR